MTPAVVRATTRTGGNVLAHGQPLRCACGSDQVAAVRPGQDGDEVAGLFALSRHVPDTAWCRACWPALRAARSATP